MSNNITISPTHGVNPTIPVCAWCGKEKNELALMGRLPHDAEAPKNCILNYDPCEECAKKWATAVVLIEVDTSPTQEGQPPIDKKRGLYPTGHLVGISEEGAREMFSDPNLHNGSRAFVAKGILPDE